MGVHCSVRNDSLDSIYVTLEATDTLKYFSRFIQWNCFILA